MDREGSVRKRLPGTKKFSILLAKCRDDCRQQASILEEKKCPYGDERLLHVVCHRMAKSLMKHEIRHKKKKGKIKIEVEVYC